MKWTSEQQQAIEIRDKNILVSAAAGSGKTAVLVERIKQLIIKDQVPLNHMLIVTFSNAAASEMREKIVEAISKELEVMSETKASKSKESFLREQLNLIHRANISTFHAFSMEVIRRYFYLIDMEPNFKICDEAQKTIFQAEAMEQLFHNLFESRNQDFLDFLSKFAMTKNENSAKEIILTAHNFIQSIPDSFFWLREKAEELSCNKESFLKSAAFLEIRSEIKRNLDISEKCFLKVEDIIDQQGITSLIPKSKLEIELVDNLKKSFNSMTFQEFGEEIRNVKFQTYTAAKAEKEDYEEIKETVSALRDRGKSIIKKLGTQYMSKDLDSYIEDLNKTHKDALYLCYLVEEFDRIYKEKKEKKGLLDFSDIEHYALKILSNDEAAKEYADKFDYIFVDEYQDSNIVQETLIGKIKRENNLFMVGDVKQSIYKFRLAEPEIFIGKYEAYKISQNQKDLKIDLNKNFRSKGSIIDCVNDVFCQIMSKELSGLEYDKAAALYEGAPYNGERIYPIDFYLVEHKQIDEMGIDDEIKEMKKAEVEAYAAAQIIKESKGTVIFDAKKGIEREVTNKDIVILLRSVKGYAEIYYEALMKEGIPAFLDNSDGYFETLEIDVFLNLLRIVDNRKQDIPLLSILRSSIFSFTMEELIQIRVQNKEGAYHKIFSEYGKSGEIEYLREKCQRTLEQIKKWKMQASFMPLEDFLWQLIRETGYYEYIGAIPGGSQRQANLRALVDKAVQFQNNQMKGLFSFINYIEAIKKRKVAMGQVRLLGENDDVVRIMTIHKSKGLEFPVVLVGGLGKGFNKDTDGSKVSFHKDIGLGLRFVDKDNSCYKKTIIQTAIEQKKKREGLAEELRILYVAFTRAMDKLILLGTLKDADEAMNKYDIKGNIDFAAAKSYMDFLIPSLEKTKIKLQLFNRKDISLKKEADQQHKDIIRRIIQGSEVFEENEKTDNILLKDEINRRLSYEYEYKQALILKSKFTVSELGKIANKDEDKIQTTVLAVPQFTKGDKAFTAAERGTILHRVMEKLDFTSIAEFWKANENKDKRTEKIKGFIDELIKKELLTKQEADTISYKKILQFFNSEIGIRALNSKNIYKEVSFNLLKEIEGENVIVQGTIDCYFEENDEYILLDYKSNYIADAEDETEIKTLVENYKMQLSLYSEALENIRGVHVGEAYLYLFGIGKPVKVI